MGVLSVLVGVVDLELPVGRICLRQLLHICCTINVNSAKKSELSASVRLPFACCTSRKYEYAPRLHRSREKGEQLMNRPSLQQQLLGSMCHRFHLRNMARCSHNSHRFHGGACSVGHNEPGFGRFYLVEIEEDLDPVCIRQDKSDSDVAAKRCLRSLELT